jgi:hypothetical protein
MEVQGPKNSASAGVAHVAEWRTLGPHHLSEVHGERLISSIRRESLDHLIIFDEVQLRRVLKNYASSYNQVRTHLSLDKNAPNFRRPQKIGTIASISIGGCIAIMSGFTF